MFATDLMNRPTAVLPTEALTSDRRALDAGVETLPVVDAEGRLIGVITGTVLPIVEDRQLVGVLDRNDLLRTLVHDDQVITSRVWSLLRDYAGLRRWGVYVVDGVVTVSSAFVDRTDRTVIRALVRTVAGVIAVQLRMEHPIVTGSAG
ncbi:MAG: CBS domain-containing protein [Pseudonocardiaceae bacterium]